MLLFFWVLLRVTLIFGSIFGLSLFLVIRAMGRQVRKDQKPGAERKSGGLNYFNHRMVGAAIVIVVTLGVRNHQWNAAMIGCAILFGILGIAWLDKARDGAISRSFLALFERGPASEDLWFQAAVPVGIILLLDTFITGEWRFSRGLAIALAWCVCWALLTRHFRRRAESQAHF